MTRAVVCLSGGLDSTAALSLAISRYGTANVAALGFFYGQRHAVEIDAAIAITRRLGLPHGIEIVEVDRRVFQGSRSTLLSSNDQKPIPSTKYREVQAQSGSQPTAVPNRNMLFLSYATSYALSRRYDEVWIGVHAGDAHNFHYPDCRPPFIGAMSAAIDLSTEGVVKLMAPFNHASKADIVISAVKTGAPLEMTRSCYQSFSVSCGTCSTCQERIEAFSQARFIDPIPYLNTPIWPVTARPFPISSEVDDED